MHTRIPPFHSPTHALKCHGTKGRFVGPRPLLKPEQLFDLAIDRMLRGCDLVKLKIDQVVVSGAARYRATIV